METKVCKHYGRELPLSDFYTNSKAKDGYATYCKVCSNAIMYGYTWLNAWEALKTLGISLGITAIIFIICFLSHKWLEE